MNIQKFEIEAHKMIRGMEMDYHYGDQLGTEFIRGVMHGMRMMLRLALSHMQEKRVA